MILPRRSFLKSIAAALAGATAIRSAVTPVAEAVEPLAEFPKKGPRIHSALLENNIVDVQHEVMARLGREWAERVDREVWLKSARRTTTLPEGWGAHHTLAGRIDWTDDVTTTTNLIAVHPLEHRKLHGLISVNTRDYAKLPFAREYFHNISFDLPHGTMK